jgi:N-acetylmuramoyl-L-alanine amidase
VRRPKAEWLAAACLGAALALSRAGPALPTAAARTAVVVLDPGHGGIDPGAPGPQGRAEKTVNWAVAQLTAARLRASGIPVLLTRTGDRAPTEPSYTEAGDLRARAHLANRVGAAVLVSIHANAEPTGRAQGPLVYYPAGSRAAYRLAVFLAQALGKATGLSARPRPARHVVLLLAMMPAVTVEVGFLTHPEEGMRLFRPEWQDRLAAGIAAGILDYLRASLFSSKTTT